MIANLLSMTGVSSFLVQDFGCRVRLIDTLLVHAPGLLRTNLSVIFYRIQFYLTTPNTGKSIFKTHHRASFPTHQSTNPPPVVVELEKTKQRDNAAAAKHQQQSQRSNAKRHTAIIKHSTVVLVLAAENCINCRRCHALRKQTGILHREQPNLCVKTKDMCCMEAFGSTLWEAGTQSRHMANPC